MDGTSKVPGYEDSMKMCELFEPTRRAAGCSPEVALRMKTLDDVQQTASVADGTSEDRP